MQDKVVVITGASAGIGAALAERIGRDGGKPVLAARRDAELAAVAARSGPDALAVVTDVTARDQVERLRDAALARFGRIDVWVNNAGRGISKPASQLDDADLDDMWLTNVKAPMYGAQAVLPHWKARGEGHLIQISSMLGRVPFAPIRSAYAAAKHALGALTACLRAELAPFPGIKISTVYPGVVATDFGLNARHGGPDSRALPGAQPVDEVVDVIAGVIAVPRDDVYTRPDGAKVVAAYYAER